MRYLVTGGAGFIGSNFIRYLFNKYGDAVQVVNLDKLTYAGIRENLAEYEGKPNYRFLQGDIAKAEDVAEAYKGVDGSGVDVVVNFAAETHVDRSLMEADTFIETDVHGVLVLLEEARKTRLKRFVQISTDEVYGSIDDGSFTESRSAESAQSVLGVESGRRPDGVRVLADVRHAGHRHARVEQLRTVPVSGEADPALRHERHR